MHFLGGPGQDRGPLLHIQSYQVAEGKRPEEDDGEELLAVDFLYFLFSIFIYFLAEHQKSGNGYYAHGGKAQKQGKTIVLRESEVGGGKEQG